jgi:hypothetical protein
VWWRSQDVASKSDIFREILRPKEGLWMTVSKLRTVSIVEKTIKFPKLCHPVYNHVGSVKGKVSDTNPVALARMTAALHFSLIRKGLLLRLLLPFA